MDSGAFTELFNYGGYRSEVSDYAKTICRWASNGNLMAAVSQDYMCEPIMLEKTGLDISTHQRLTIERYDALMTYDLPVYIMPVLQGYNPAEYVAHIDQYGERIALDAWVGVGSVCKRNTNVSAIEAVLLAIHDIRPDLKLHGFGVKSTALNSAVAQDLLYSSDSMAWSYAARREGRNPNDWREAMRYKNAIENLPVQMPLFI